MTVNELVDWLAKIKKDYKAEGTDIGKYAVVFQDDDEKFAADIESISLAEKHNRLILS